MRIWSIHPKYLDAKGLVALWRETLLAKNVLVGNTIGYKNHPQLNRFKLAQNPEDAINFYLKSIWLEAKDRNYNFDKNKLAKVSEIDKIKVTRGQLDYEKHHLLNKLKVRDLIKYNSLRELVVFEPHSLFYLVDGEIESWEKV